MTSQEINEKINALYTEVQDLQNSLQGEDYKVIKCAEAKVRDLPMPYNTEELIARRNDYRKAINDAQAEIERLKELEPEDKFKMEERLKEELLNEEPLK